MKIPDTDLLSFGYEHKDFLGDYSAWSIGDTIWTGLTGGEPEFNPYEQGVPLYDMNAPAGSGPINPVIYTEQKPSLEEKAFVAPSVNQSNQLFHPGQQYQSTTQKAWDPNQEGVADSLRAFNLGMGNFSVLNANLAKISNIEQNIPPDYSVLFSSLKKIEIEKEADMSSFSNGKKPPRKEVFDNLKTNFLPRPETFIGDFSQTGGESSFLLPLFLAAGAAVWFKTK